jgi:hypothetical protein
MKYTIEEIRQMQEGQTFDCKRLNPVYISDNQNLTISMVMI